jgi:type I restriction enzyme, R subunit
MTEFKQIIGRGSRVRDDYGKLWFNILDYTGSATQLFADPDFDGEPAKVTQEEIDEADKTISIQDGRNEAEPDDEDGDYAVILGTAAYMADPSTGSS